MRKMKNKYNKTTTKEKNIKKHKILIICKWIKTIVIQLNLNVSCLSSVHTKCMQHNKIKENKRKVFSLLFQMFRLLLFVITIIIACTLFLF